MPEVESESLWKFSPEQWRRYAAFHSRAAGIMEAVAEAIATKNKVRYHQAMAEFAELSQGQKSHEPAPVSA